MDIKKSIIFNLRWHRRIGLSLFFMVIFLAITGFALNHSPGLKLNKIQLTNNWLLSWYGFEQPEINGYNLSGNWLYHNGGNQLFYNQKMVGSCQAPLQSAGKTVQLVLALCDDSLLLLSPQGQLIERFSHFQGLPTAVNQIKISDEIIFLSDTSNNFIFNPESLIVTAIDKTPVGSLSITAEALPDSQFADVISTGNGASISMETLILDLHSGRFFGNAGVLFVDIVGLLMCILAITGLWAWINHQRLRKR